VKLIYKGGTTKKEKEEYAMAIRRNCIESMQTILEAMTTLQLEFADAELIPIGESREASVETKTTAQARLVWYQKQRRGLSLSS